MFLKIYITEYSSRINFNSPRPLLVPPFLAAAGQDECSQLGDTCLVSQIVSVML